MSSNNDFIAEMFIRMSKKTSVTMKTFKESCQVCNGYFEIVFWLLLMFTCRNILTGWKIFIKNLI